MENPHVLENALRHPLRKKDDVLYVLMLKKLENAKPRDLEEALFVTLPRMYRDTITAFGLIPQVDGTLRIEPMPHGTRAVFWNGAMLGLMRFDSTRFWTADHMKLVARIAAIAQMLGIKPAIVDLGSGVGALALAARHLGYDWPFINIEVDQYALECARIIHESVGTIRDVTQIGTYVSDALREGASRSALERAILDAAAGAPIIVTSRQAIVDFNTYDEIMRLRDFYADGLSARAGVFLEGGAWATPTFRMINAQIPGLELLQKRARNMEYPPDIVRWLVPPRGTIVEYQEIWPAFIDGRAISYISWVQ